MTTNDYQSSVSRAILNNPSPCPNGLRSGIHFGFFSFDSAEQEGNDELDSSSAHQWLSELKRTAQKYRVRVDAQNSEGPVLLITGNYRQERERFISELVKSMGHWGVYRFTGVETEEHVDDIAYLLAEPMGVLYFTGMTLEALLSLIPLLHKRHKANTVIISIASIDMVPSVFTQHIDLDDKQRKGEPLFKLGSFALYREGSK